MTWTTTIKGSSKLLSVSHQISKVISKMYIEAKFLMLLYQHVSNENYLESKPYHKSWEFKHCWTRVDISLEFNLLPSKVLSVL